MDFPGKTYDAIKISIRRPSSSIIMMDPTFIDALVKAFAKEVCSCRPDYKDTPPADFIRLFNCADRSLLYGMNTFGSNGGYYGNRYDLRVYIVDPEGDEEVWVVAGSQEDNSLVKVKLKIDKKGGGCEDFDWRNVFLHSSRVKQWHRSSWGWSAVQPGIAENPWDTEVEARWLKRASAVDAGDEEQLKEEEKRKAKVSAPRPEKPKGRHVKTTNDDYFGYNRLVDGHVEGDADGGRDERLEADRIRRIFELMNSWRGDIKGLEP